MLKPLVESLRDLLFLARETRDNREAITSLQRQVAELTRTVDRLCDHAQHRAEAEQAEREKLALALENALLRFERRLPPEGGKPPRRR